MTKDYDYVVIGGGLVGSAIAYGLGRCGLRIALLDEGDLAIRASRGNFGLVWLQGKGVDFPHYSDWTRLSIEAWPDLAAELLELTGIDVAYTCPGGLDICLDEHEYQARASLLRRLHDQTEGRFPYQMLDNQSARELLPALSPAVAGASYCPLDGHTNPLFLLRALHDGLQRRQVQYLPNRTVSVIRPQSSGFAIQAGQDTIHCERLVLCAGLGNRALGRMLGLSVPVSPNKGQILVTEKLQPFLALPTAQVRQTAEGGVMIGDSHEETGLETSTSSTVMAAIANRAVRMFPLLDQVRLLRAWAALRVMTPDGKPIYEQAPAYPGAAVVSCHSGVTLAANHALRLPAWLLGEQALPAIAPFSASRFERPLQTDSPQTDSPQPDR